MTTTQLTPAQHTILAHAVEHTQGQIDWFPDTIKGGARLKVLAGLANRGLAIHQDSAWRATPAAYDALGARRPDLDTGYTGYGASRVLLDEIDEADPTDVEIAESNAVDPVLEGDMAAADARCAPAAEAPRLRTRENTKQATLIAMLRRPEGATIAQLCTATGWQAHTVRGTFAGALKKKLGLTLVSEKVKGEVRVYRIAGEAA
jgi:hypothetical protein